MEAKLKKRFKVNPNLRSKFKTVIKGLLFMLCMITAFFFFATLGEYIGHAIWYSNYSIDELYHLMPTIFLQPVSIIIMAIIFIINVVIFIIVHNHYKRKTFNIKVNSF